MSQPTMEELRQRAAWAGTYAAAPGSGPEGESCKTCKHSGARRRMVETDVGHIARGRALLFCGLVTAATLKPVHRHAAACAKWVAP